MKRKKVMFKNAKNCEKVLKSSLFPLSVLKYPYFVLIC